MNTISGHALASGAAGWLSACIDNAEDLMAGLLERDREHTYV